MKLLDMLDLIPSSCQGANNTDYLCNYELEGRKGTRCLYKVGDMNCSKPQYNKDNTFTLVPKYFNR